MSMKKVQKAFALNFGLLAHNEFQIRFPGEERSSGRIARDFSREKCNLNRGEALSVRLPYHLIAGL